MRIILILAILMIGLVVACQGPTPLNSSPMPQVSSSPLANPSVSPVPSASSTPTSTPTTSPGITPTPTTTVLITPTPTPKSLGNTAITLELNRITGEQSHYGVYLWVEKADGTFVKTLSWYLDWGKTATDGGKFTVNGSSNNHLLQSDAWRTKAGVTTNPGVIDAFTSATINAVPTAPATTVTVVFNGTQDTKSKLTGLVADEYFLQTFTQKLKGWDGTDANGQFVTAGNYVIRLTISRHYSNSPASPSPYFTEYSAVLAVGATSNSASLSVIGSEVASGSGGPVLKTSSVVFTPTP